MSISTYRGTSWPNMRSPRRRRSSRSRPPSTAIPTASCSAPTMSPRPIWRPTSRSMRCGPRSSPGSVRRPGPRSSWAITNGCSTPRACACAPGRERMRPSVTRMAAALLAAASSPALALESEEQPAPVVEEGAALPAPSLANAPGEADPAQAAAELRELQAMKQEMQQKMGDFDARIEALESRLGVPHSPVSVPVETAAQTVVGAETAAGAASETEEQTQWGKYEPGRGFILVRSKYGELGS